MQIEVKVGPVKNYKSIDPNSMEWEGISHGRNL